jgi:hypothetical protein
MKDSKISKIRDWLVKGNIINLMIAIQMFDCIDLKNVIYRLRKEGLNIKSKTTYGLTKYYIEQE